MNIEVGRIIDRWEENRRFKRFRFFDQFPELIKFYQETIVRMNYYHGISFNIVHGFSWFGVGSMQFPTDYFAYMETIFNDPVAPRIIVETGTLSGSTTAFFAECLRRKHNDKDYRVLTVEIATRPETPDLPGIPTAKNINSDSNIISLIGSSVDPNIVQQIKKLCPNDWPIMVTLDSDHSALHVINEIAAYAPLVSSGQYLVVQDTYLGLSWGGNLTAPNAKDAVDREDTRAFDYQGGPLGAVEAFLDIYGDEFELDLTKQRWVIIQSPFGFLRRK